MSVEGYLLMFLQNGNFKAKVKCTHRDVRRKLSQRHSNDDQPMINHEHVQELVPILACRWQCRPLDAPFGLRETVSEDWASEELGFQSQTFTPWCEPLHFGRWILKLFSLTPFSPLAFYLPLFYSSTFSKSKNGALGTEINALLFFLRLRIN